jgi:hypothetical protein
VGLLHDLAADELHTALEAAGWDAEKLTALVHCIKREKATGPLQGGSSKNCTKGEGPTAPEQVQPEETILLPDAVKSILLEIANYAVERDGKLHPNDGKWRLLVLRAKAMFAFEASAAELLPVARDQ